MNVIGSLQAHRGLELADAHAEAAVAHHRDGLHLRPRDMRAHGSGERIAESAVRAVGEKAPPGAAHHVVRREIRARRAGIGDHDGVFIQAFACRSATTRSGLIGRLVGARKAVELLELGTFLLFDKLEIAVAPKPLQRFVQRRKAEPRIADERHVDLVVGAGHGGIDVDVDDPRLARRRMAPALGGHRAGAAADEDHHVRRIDHRARLRRAAVRSDHADRARAALVDRALAADRRGDRRAERLGERQELRFRAGREQRRRRR